MAIIVDTIPKIEIKASDFQTAKFIHIGKNVEIKDKETLYLLYRKNATFDKSLNIDLAQLKKEVQDYNTNIEKNKNTIKLLESKLGMKISEFNNIIKQ